MLSGLFSKKEKKEVNWTPLTTVDELKEMNERSYNRPVLIFKHSTRCAISSMVINKFESAYQENASFDSFYLDLITYREVSNQIASQYGVVHQSPQAILISKGAVVLEDSHNGINFEEIDQKSREIM